MSAALSRDSVERALREMLADEVARVHGAAPVLPETDGWRARTGPDVVHRIEWARESWQWFELVDLSVVHRMAVLAFRWLDPATPEMIYLPVAHIDGSTSPTSAALVARQQVRRLLAPGWRGEVERTWLAARTVLIRRPTDKRRPVRRAELRESMWHEGRDAR